jgi:hypothetical protein
MITVDIPAMSARALESVWSRRRGERPPSERYLVFLLSFPQQMQPFPCATAQKAASWRHSVTGTALMTSARLVLAAQTNGAKSRGPKTAEGKRRSAANSRTHGLCSAKITPDAEAESELRDLLPALIAEYNPSRKPLLEFTGPGV